MAKPPPLLVAGPLKKDRFFGGFPKLKLIVYPHWNECKDIQWAKNELLNLMISKHNAQDVPHVREATKKTGFLLTL